MPIKKKEDVPQGKNELTATIEKIMQDFGGTKYKAYTVSAFLQEVNGRLDACMMVAKGPIKVLTANLKRRVNKKTKVEDILMELNETLFAFFEGGD